MQQNVEDESEPRRPSCPRPGNESKDKGWQQDNCRTPYIQFFHDHLRQQSAKAVMNAMRAPSSTGQRRSGPSTNPKLKYVKPTPFLVDSPAPFRAHAEDSRLKHSSRVQVPWSRQMPPNQLLLRSTSNSISPGSRSMSPETGTAPIEIMDKPQKY